MQKKLLFAGTLVCLALAGHAQTDTTKSEKPDTVRIGDMIIVKKKDPSGSTEGKSGTTISWKKSSRPRKSETSYFTVDLGFSNYRDESVFPANSYAPGLDAGDFELRNGKSANVNIWLFRQKYGLDRSRVLQLTYGLMLELNNYRYEQNISYTKNPAMVTLDDVSFSKNKLALDYVTVPLMLGINTKPGTNRGFTVSGGVSIGYLYSSRNKQVSGERGKQKTRGNLGIEPWKFQYVGEIGLGPIKLYGSYAPHNMYKTELNMQPYNFGLRLGDW